MTSLIWLLCFNSTMVRLKDITPSAAGAYNMFQFHYGTIKRASGVGPQGEVVRFQFHYGTIKREHLQARPAARPRFNSTMVRLKEYPLIRDVEILMFQFHYGTIKSPSQAYKMLL